MSKPIVLHPVDMTPEIMQMLEDKGLIIRLWPGRPPLPVTPGRSAVATLYASDPQYGPHKLIAVTVNSPRFRGFGCHFDNEEFLLIGNPAARPLYLVVGLCPQEELKRKVAAGQISAADFVLLRVRFNDPDVSFFTMLKGVSHCEASADGEGDAPSFFVTEPRDLQGEHMPLGEYELQVGD